MTKKHFQAIAEILKEEFEQYGPNTTARTISKEISNDLAKKMADYFKSENANFDRSRFLSACGVE